jgi:hypothetical protein
VQHPEHEAVVERGAVEQRAAAGAVDLQVVERGQARGPDRDGDQVHGEREREQPGQQPSHL